MEASGGAEIAPVANVVVPYRIICDVGIHPSVTDKKARMRSGPPKSSEQYFSSTQMRQHGQQQKRNNIGDLDHRIDGRAGRVLVGVADGVAGDGGFVGV